MHSGFSLTFGSSSFSVSAVVTVAFARLCRLAFLLIHWGLLSLHDFPQGLSTDSKATALPAQLPVFTDPLD